MAFAIGAAITSRMDSAEMQLPPMDMMAMQHHLTAFSLDLRLSQNNPS